MANTHDFGPLFVTFVDLKPGLLPLHIGKSQEVEAPFRASEVLILRIPIINKGLALGWWRHTGLNEEDALLRAMEGYGLDLYDEDLDDPEVREVIRTNIARHAEGIDDEWLVLNAFGVAD